MVAPTKDIEIGAAFGIGVDTLDHLIGLIVGVRPDAGDLLVFAVLLLDQVAPLVIGEGDMGLPTVAGLLRDLIQITFHYPLRWYGIGCGGQCLCSGLLEKGENS